MGARTMTFARRLAFVPVVLILSAIPARGGTTYVATLTGPQEVPTNTSAGTGIAVVVLDTTTDQITVDLSFSDLLGLAIAAGLYGPAGPGTDGPLVVPFDLGTALGQSSGMIAEQTFTITAAQAADLESGMDYINLNSTAFPGGEIRGQVVPEPSTLSLAVAAILCAIGWRTAAIGAWPGRRRPASPCEGAGQEGHL
jgi:hypothetical protein